MGLILASSGLAPWGQAASIVLAIYLFVSIVVGLAFTAILMFGVAWIHEKSELVKSIRPLVKELNATLEASQQKQPLPKEVADNKLMQAVAQVPKVAASLPATATRIEERVEHGTDSVANAVIEFRARTAMVQGMARAFFLPGLTRRRTRPVSQQARSNEAEQIVQTREDVAAAEVVGEPPIYEREMTMVQSSRS